MSFDTLHLTACSLQTLRWMWLSLSEDETILAQRISGMSKVTLLTNDRAEVKVQSYLHGQK